MKGFEISSNYFSSSSEWSNLYLLFPHIIIHIQAQDSLVAFLPVFFGVITIRGEPEVNVQLQCSFYVCVHVKLLPRFEVYVLVVPILAMHSEWEGVLGETLRLSGVQVMQTTF